MAAGGANEPNLTPFIDLFSVLICFLLMTAAWIQLESMQVQIDPKKDATASSEPNETPPPPDEKKIRLSVQLHPDKVVVREDETDTEIPNVEGGLDKGKIAAVLGRWREKYPEKRNLVLGTEATVTYGAMIRLYDLLIASDWPDVGINPY